MIGRDSRSHRRRESSECADAIEFAELLDPIAVPAASALPAADADVMERPDEVPAGDVVVEAAMVSRFAAAGIDDDRLPAGVAKRRFLRR